MYWLVVLVAVGGVLATRRRAPNSEAVRPAPSERVAPAEAWKQITTVERFEFAVVAVGMILGICVVLFAIESLLLTM